LSYRYRLIGLSDKWSNWSVKTEKDYTNLTPGNYSFEVVVKDNFGQISVPVVFPFYVAPPWYQTLWAYFLYFLIVGFTSVHVVRWQRKKFKRQQDVHKAQQARLQYMHQLEIEKAESELIALRNEKLQNEIDHKNSELATNAMHLVQKGELISKMKAELNHILKGVNTSDQTATDIRKMIKMLSEDDRMDKDWDHFSQHFDKVNSDFISILKEKHPNVTANEIKLCTYLRMNLSTKEIAQLMNISVRGVEISRYRLRKKINISTDTNLFDYLIGLQQNN
jgi:DNA-binding CsgD family transcriptional regulator